MRAEGATHISPGQSETAPRVYYSMLVMQAVSPTQLLIYLRICI